MAFCEQISLDLFQNVMDLDKDLFALYVLVCLAASASIIP